MLFKELKRHLDKPDEVYMCDLVVQGDGWAVLSYVSNRSWEVAGTLLPIGSQTLAWYRTGASQVLWRMSGPQGQLKGYLFHLCRDVVVEKKQVSYQDLLLDVWVSAGGIVTVLDREDVEACQNAGKISGADLQLIEAGETAVVEKWQSLVAEFDGLLK